MQKAALGFIYYFLITLIKFFDNSKDFHHHVMSRHLLGDYHTSNSLLPVLNWLH